MRPSQTAALVAYFFGTVCLLAFNQLTSYMGISGISIGNYAYPLAVLMQGFAFALPTLLYYSVRPEKKPSLRMGPLDPLCGLLIALSAIVGMLVLNQVSYYWHMLLTRLGLIVSAGGTAAPRTAQQLLYMVLSVAIAPAICEELLFRGFLLPSMETIGRGAAVAISGLMFALLHGRVEALPSHIIVGVLLSLLALKTDSLKAAMLYHSVYNAAILISAYIVSLMPRMQAATSLPPSYTLLFTVVLASAWIFLLYLAFDRGAKTRLVPLAPAKREPMTSLAAIMLSACGMLLLMIQFGALLGMLPTAPP